MKKFVLITACICMADTTLAGAFKQEVDALYRPADAKTAKLMVQLPPRVSAGAADNKGVSGGATGTPGKGGGGCPQNVNIGSVQGRNNHLQRFDSTVVINAPIVIRCR